jgi:molybdopterin-guanine dinucleotide biosynthesis protein
MGRVGLFLVRFGKNLETAYGLTREVLLVISPFSDLQWRTYGALEEVLTTIGSAAGRDITKHLVLVCTTDQREIEKLDEWSRARSILAIPIGGLTNQRLSNPTGLLADRLRLRIYKRNVYRCSTPVESDQFYGREIALQKLRDSMELRNAIIILGLRKSGKTSLMKEAGRRFRSKNRHFVYTDLERLPAPPARSIPDLLLDLVDKISEEFAEAGIDVSDFSDRLSASSVSEFRRSLSRLLDRNTPRDFRLVIAFDEIEHLCPPRLISEEGQTETREITQFFAAMRSLVQENEKFTFLLAGLSPAVIDQQMLYGLHNPIFQWAGRHYVSPFELQESNELLNTLGGRMGVTWTPIAVRRALSASGGQAFLLRQLAAEVADRFSPEQTDRNIYLDDVENAISKWRVETISLMLDTLQHLERYYPGESKMLRQVFKSSSGDLIRLNPKITSSKSINNLAGLGLVIIDGTTNSLRPAHFLNFVLGNQNE